MITIAPDLADPTDNHAGYREMMGRIVRAEMANWVPGASQRLLNRVGHHFGFLPSGPLPFGYDWDDCGPDRAAHALIPDWVADVYVHRCATCHRLYPA
jgi:hypothetical protein